MTITIKLNTDNAAFENKDAEIVRILEWLGNDWQAIHSEGVRNLFDVNGNKVGTVKVTGN